MTTYTVTVDGISFDHGMVKGVAESLVCLLKDAFPDANLTVIEEK